MCTRHTHTLHLSQKNIHFDALSALFSSTLSHWIIFGWSFCRFFFYTQHIKSNKKTRMNYTQLSVQTNGTHTKWLPPERSLQTEHYFPYSTKQTNFWLVPNHNKAVLFALDTKAIITMIIKWCFMHITRRHSTILSMLKGNIHNAPPFFMFISVFQTLKSSETINNHTYTPNLTYAKS